VKKSERKAELPLTTARHVVDWQREDRARQSQSQLDRDAICIGSVFTHSSNGRAGDFGGQDNEGREKV
jgi:hypothetical protein